MVHAMLQIRRLSYQREEALANTMNRVQIELNANEPMLELVANKMNKGN